MSIPGDIFPGRQPWCLSAPGHAAFQRLSSHASPPSMFTQGTFQLNFMDHKICKPCLTFLNRLCKPRWKRFFICKILSLCIPEREMQIVSSHPVLRLCQSFFQLTMHLGHGNIFCIFCVPNANSNDGFNIIVDLTLAEITCILRIPCGISRKVNPFVGRFLDNPNL
jgi:hypothetical protein